MNKGFKWRDSTAAAQTSQPSQQRVQQGIRAGYESLALWLPASVPNVVPGVDEWLTAVDAKLTNEDKVFIGGFFAALQLSGSQKQKLLEMYAERYQQALKRAGSNPAKYSIAKRAANQWVGAGASGFIVRE